MPHIKEISRIFKGWLYAILFLTLFLTLLAGFSPLLVEEFILPPVLAKIGLADYKFSISRLGINGCSLHISGRPDRSTPVITGNLRIDWTPSGLMDRRINNISGNNLQINLISLQTKKSQKQKPPTRPESKKDKQILLPVVVDKINIQNGSLLFQNKGRTVYLPYSFSLQSVDKQGLTDPTGGINFQAQLQVGKHNSIAFITLLPDEGKLSCSLDTNLALASLTPLIPNPDERIKELAGSAQITLDTSFQITPFKLERLSATIGSRDLNIAGDDFAIQSEKDRPATIAISKTGSTYQVLGSGFYLNGPVQTPLKFDTHVSSIKKSLQWEGSLELRPEKGPLLIGGLVLTNIQPVRILHTISQTENKTTFKFSKSRSEAIEEKNFLSVTYNNIEAEIADLEIDAQITIDKKSAANSPGVMFILAGRNGYISFPEGIAQMPKFEIQSDGTGFPSSETSLTSTLFEVEGASIELEKKNIKLHGLSLRLPFTWPFIEKDVKKGSLVLDSIHLDGKKGGSIEANIFQLQSSLKFDGYLNAPFFPEEKVSMNGFLKLPKEKDPYASLAFSLNNGQADVRNFTDGFPSLQGINGRGLLDIKGEMRLSACGISGMADIALKNGSLKLSDKETELSDINLDLHLPALPSVNSLPQQQFSIGTLKKKKILINNIKTSFEIESPGSLFVERISGNWSGGRIFTSSFRLGKEQEELNVALFCDRLELATILSQFNLAEAGGKGKMSGRVPIAYTKGKFYVDDGFLFSTPGEKGNLKIKKSSYLETTIPANAPHFSPLHFAGAALADFEYNWAKLQINSEEENLLLKLQIDGKPKEKLPYRFDTRKQVFVRLDDETKGGIDQPLRLDVNFNIPFNEMFQYKNKIMPLFKKIN